MKFGDFYCLTDLFWVSPEGLGVVFQIFMKLVIYLAPCILVLRPPFKHERPPAYVKLCASLCFKKKKSVMIFQDSDGLKRINIFLVCVSSYKCGG